MTNEYALLALLAEAKARLLPFVGMTDVVVAKIDATLASAVEPEARLTEMNFKAKAGEPIEAYAQFEGGAVKAFAVSLVQWFRESGGENYVTCDLRDPTTGEAYSITMQKAGGRTPAQDLCELRQQLNRPAPTEKP